MFLKGALLSFIILTMTIALISLITTILSEETPSRISVENAIHIGKIAGSRYQNNVIQLKKRNGYFDNDNNNVQNDMSDSSNIQEGGTPEFRPVRNPFYNVNNRFSSNSVSQGSPQVQDENPDDFDPSKDDVEANEMKDAKNVTVSGNIAMEGLNACSGSNSSMIPDTFALTPYPPVRDQNFNITVVGTFTRAVTDGSTYQIVVTGFGRTGLDKTEKLCDSNSYFGLKCPLEVGEHYISYQHKAPANLKSGAYTYRVTMHHGDGQEITCVTGTINM